MKKATLILTFIAALIYSCGGPDWREVTEKQDLKSSDWKFDEDGYFTECPAIAGCDEDGDCLMNVDDSNVSELDDWRTVCESLATCMQDYVDEYQECVGGDFDEIITEVTGQTAAEYFKDSPEVLESIANSLLQNFGPYLTLGNNSSFMKEAKNMKLVWRDGNLQFSDVLDGIKKLKIVTQPKRWFNRNEGSQETSQPPAVEDVVEDEAEADIPNGDPDILEKHGQEPFKGPYEVEFTLNTCADTGAMLFGESDNYLELISGNRCVGSAVPASKVSKKSASDQTSTLIAGDYQIIEKKGQMTLTSVSPEAIGMDPKSIAVYAIEIEKVGCYPYGGRTAANIDPGDPVLYDSIDEMLSKEQEICEGLFKQAGYQTVKCEPKTLPGTVQKFNLQGVTQGNGMIVYADALKEYKRGGTDRALRNGPYCFSSNPNNYEHVLVKATVSGKATGNSGGNITGNSGEAAKAEEKIPPKKKVHTSPGSFSGCAGISDEDKSQCLAGVWSPENENLNCKEILSCPGVGEMVEEMENKSEEAEDYECDPEDDCTSPTHEKVHFYTVDSEEECNEIANRDSNTDCKPPVQIWTLRGTTYKCVCFVYSY